MFLVCPECPAGWLLRIMFLRDVPEPFRRGRRRDDHGAGRTPGDHSFCIEQGGRFGGLEVDGKRLTQTLIDSLPGRTRNSRKWKAVKSGAGGLGQPARRRTRPSAASPQSLGEMRCQPRSNGDARHRRGDRCRCFPWMAFSALGQFRSKSSEKQLTNT